MLPLRTIRSKDKNESCQLSMKEFNWAYAALQKKIEAIKTGGWGMLGGPVCEFNGCPMMPMRLFWGVVQRVSLFQEMLRV